MGLEHPADCYGDAGAATGAILVALATDALRAQHLPGRIFVFASSDREAVGCAHIE